MFSTQVIKENFQDWLISFNSKFPAHYENKLLKKRRGDTIENSMKTFDFSIAKIATNIKDTDSNEQLNIFCAVWSFLVYKYTEQELIYIGYNYLAHQNVQGTDTYGVAPIVHTINEETSFADVLQEVGEQRVRNKVLEELSDQDHRNYLNTLKASEFQPSILLSEKKYRSNPKEKLDGLDQILIAFEEDENELRFNVHYDATIYEDEFIASLIHSFKCAYAYLLSHPNAFASSFTFTNAEQQEVLLNLSFGERKEVNPKTLIQRFEENAIRYPDNIALEFREQRVTYKNLNEKTNCIANTIVNSTDTTLIGICLKRSIEMVSSILGIQKTGAAYLPLDPTHPRSRLEKVLDQSKIEILITSKKFASIFNGIDIKLVFVEEIDWGSIDDAHHGIDSKDTAYVIYTSGSTGTPKGVSINHSALINRIDWMQSEYQLSTGDKVLQKTPFTFDVSVWEFFWPLSHNATLVIAPPNAQKEPLEIKRLIEEHEVTMIHFVPSALEVFLEFHESNENKSIRKVFCSGEALTYNQISKFKEHFPQAELHNLYGPTEAAIDVTYWPVKDNTVYPTPPIGKSIQNVQCIVLKDQKLAPIGMIGELYLSGICLADAYYNDLELTKKYFLENPFSGGNEMYNRMYRTGDLARYLPSGDIEYLGRNDHQVKIRGNRIELSEINYHLDNIEHIKNAFTLPIDDKLVAFVSLSKTDQVLSALEKEFRAILSNALPEYMLPHHFCEIQSLPLTVNGKIDRRKLIDHFKDSLSTANIRETENVGRKDERQELVKIWSEVLKIPESRIDPSKSFLEQGGDSLTMLKVIAKCKRKGISLTLQEFVKTPYLRVVQVPENDVLNASKNADTQKEYFTNDYFMLSPIQQWFFEHNTLGLNFLLHASYYINSALNKENTIAKILKKVIQKHPSLRLKFKNINGVWLQKYATNVSEELLYFRDFTGTKNVDLQYCIDQALQEIKLGGYTPLIFAAIFKEKDREVLFLSCHHLIMDAVSWQLMLQDIEWFFGNNREHLNHDINNDTSNSYREWIIKNQLSVNRLLSEEEVRFWTHQNAVSHWEQPEPTLDAELTLQFENKELASNTEVQDIMISSILLGLKKSFNRTEFVFEREGHGRDAIGDYDMSNTIGWFTSKFPIKYDVQTEDLSDLKDDVSAINAKIPNSGIGYGILKYLAPKYISDQLQATCNIGFNFLGDILVDHTVADHEKGIVSNHSIFTASIGNVKIGTNDQPIEADIPYWMNINGWIQDNVLHLEIQKSKKMGLSNDQWESFENDIKNAINSQLIDHHKDKLTPFQKGLVSHAMSNPDSDRYIVQLQIKVSQQIQFELFQKACDILVKRYEILRTVYSYDYDLGEFQSEVLDNRSVVCEEFLMDSDHERENLKSLIAQHINFNFGTTNELLIRFLVAKSKGEDDTIVITAHHLILDGRSLHLIMEELKAIYSELMRGSVLKIEAHKKIQFSSYLDWVNAQNKTTSLAYWKKKLEGGNVPTLIEVTTDVVSKENGEAKVFDVVSKTIDLNPEIVKVLSSRGATISATFNYILGLVVSRYFGEKKLIFGNVVTLRPDELSDAQDIIGPCIATIPIVLEVTDATNSLLEDIKALQLQVLESREHAYLGVNEILNASGITDPMNILYSYQNVGGNHDLKEGIDQTVSSDISSHFPLTMVVNNGANSINLQVSFHTKLFPEYVMNTMMQSIEDNFNQLLYAIEGNKSSQIIQESKLSKIYGEHIENTVPKESLVQFFEKMVTAYPDRIAIDDFDGKRYSYRELDMMSNYITEQLAKKDQHIPVGICMKRSIKMIASIIGVLKAGCYVASLEPDFPENKLNQIINELNIENVISDGQSPVVDTLNIKNSIVLLKDIPLVPNHTVQREIVTENVCTVNYTSGSTGVPKLVMIDQLSHLNRIEWLQEKFPSNANDMYSFKTLLSFAPAFREIFEPLVQGSRLKVYPNDVLGDLDKFVDFVSQNNITRVFLTPSFLQLIMDHDATDKLSKVKYLEISGEPVQNELIEKLHQKQPQIQIFNRYGATETASVVYNQFQTGDDRLGTDYFPVGKPIKNTSIHIVDKYMRYCPIGVVGEILIDSGSLAMGYKNKEQGKEAFIVSPFDVSRRVFKTGDYGFINDRNELCYIGRKNRMVKVRGFRVEPSEIEHYVEKYEAVDRAVATPISNQFGNKIAVFCTVNNDQMQVSELRSFLKIELPGYMIPQDIKVVLDIPLTRSGKIDYRSLIKSLDIEEDGGSKPQRASENKLISIFSKILNKKKLGLRDDFFDLGIDSLTILRVIYEIKKEFKLHIAITDLYELHTIEELASLLDVRAASNEKSNPYTIINEGKENDLLFLFPPAGGNSGVYRDIEKYLPDNLTAILFDWMEYDEEDFSIGEISRKYVDHILKIKGERKINVAGWSLGGTIAYEVSNQIKAQGLKMNTTILIDPGFNTSDYDDQLTKEKLANLCKQLVDNEEGQDGFLEDMIDTMYRDSKLIQNYEPTVSEQDITLIKPLEITENERNYRKPYNGLEKFCLGDIEVVKVEGNHMTMLESAAKYLSSIIFPATLKMEN